MPRYRPSLEDFLKHGDKLDTPLICKSFFFTKLYILEAKFTIHNTTAALLRNSAMECTRSLTTLSLHTDLSTGWCVKKCKVATNWNTWEILWTWKTRYSQGNLRKKCNKQKSVTRCRFPPPGLQKMLWNTFATTLLVELTQNAALDDHYHNYFSFR